MFDWQRFCDTYSIPVSREGKSYHKGNIYIACPWCGDGKPLMGLSVRDTSWGCWKDAWHRGRNPLRLVRALLRISTTQAQEIIRGSGPQSFDYDDIASKLADLGPTKDAERAADEVEPDPSFEKLEPDDWFCRYLERRGFEDPIRLAEYYALRRSTWGRYKSRLIFPVMVHGKLVGWTGRAIVGASIRYLAHSSLKDVVYNFDTARGLGGDVLLIVEGPFDALKVDYYGSTHGVQAVALMGTALTPGKTQLLFELAKGFDRVGLLLDEAALSESMRITQRLSCLDVEQFRLTEADDPGDLSKEQVLALVQRVSG